MDEPQIMESYKLLLSKPQMMQSGVMVNDLLLRKYKDPFISKINFSLKNVKRKNN